jgi:hypothetical protein
MQMHEKFIFFFLFLLESIQKFRLLKKSAHLVLITSLEKAIWNWMDTYPHEFADLQVFSSSSSISIYCIQANPVTGQNHWI